MRNHAQAPAKPYTLHPMHRRLLSDNSPRAQKALHDLLYGTVQRLDIQRLTRIAGAVCVGALLP